MRGVVRGGRRRGVAVRNNEDAADRNEDGDYFVEADFLAEERNAKGIGEEGGAVVNGREVAGSRHVHRDVPAAAGDREGARHESRHLENVGNGRELGLARGGL